MGVGALIALVSIGLGGVLALGGLLLGAYKVRLDAQREQARITSASVNEGMLARIDELEERIERLTERADFTDRLLTSGGTGARSGE